MRLCGASEMGQGQGWSAAHRQSMCLGCGRLQNPRHRGSRWAEGGSDVMEDPYSCAPYFPSSPLYCVHASESRGSWKLETETHCFVWINMLQNRSICIEQPQPMR